MQLIIISSLINLSSPHRGVGRDVVFRDPPERNLIWVGGGNTLYKHQPKYNINMVIL